MSNIYIYLKKTRSKRPIAPSKKSYFYKTSETEVKTKTKQQKNMRQTRRRAWNISRPLKKSEWNVSQNNPVTSGSKVKTMNENAYSTYWLKLMILYNKRKQEKKTYYLRVVNRKKKHSEEEKLLLYYYWLRTSRKKVAQRKSEWNIEKTKKKKNIWKVYKAKHTLVFISVLILEPVSFELSLYCLVCLSLSTLFLFRLEKFTSFLCVKVNLTLGKCR